MPLPNITMEEIGYSILKQTCGEGIRILFFLLTKNPMEKVVIGTEEMGG